MTLAMLFAVACRSVSGPIGPDAELVVDGMAGPDVRTDTIEMPFTMSLDRARWRARPASSAGAGFWAAVAALDLAGAEREAKNLDQHTFIASLRKLMEGDPQSAALGFRILNASARDSTVRTRARVGLTMALTWNSDWEALASLRTNDSLAVVSETAHESEAGVERWAHAFMGRAPATVSMTEAEFTLPMRRSALGTPVVTVLVNGHRYEFWLDTGASMTLLSTDVANEANVPLAAYDTLALGVVGGRIEARAVLVDSLVIGGLVARGLSAAVVAPSMLRFDRRKEHGVEIPVRIDGVIGADLLRQMDLILDPGAGTITIRKPRPERRETRNLFWIGYPVVRLIGPDGRPLLFGLDTGAEGTFVTRDFLRKYPRTGVALRRMQLGGLGGNREMTEWVARDVALSDGSYALRLQNAPIAADQHWAFVMLDGMIGSDVALGARLHLDFANGVFEVRPSVAFVNPPGERQAPSP